MKPRTFRARAKPVVLAITGTRADYGLVRPVLRAIRRSRKLSLRLLVTGIHTVKAFGNTAKDIRRDGLRIDATVPIAASDTMLTALAKEIRGIEAYCLMHRVSMILVLGDRDEMLAGALVGGHMKIPVAHIRGGEISGYVVDEPIRHAITKFSHLHFAASRKSAARILKFGEEPRRTFFVGAPDFDDLRTIRYPTKIQLAKQFGFDPKKRWILVIQHPVALDPVPIGRQIKATLDAIAPMDAEKIIFYPNSDTGHDEVIRALTAFAKRPDVHLFPNLPREDYVRLMKRCDVLVGNSSSGIVESGFFNVPVVDIGNRQRRRETGGNVIHAPCRASAISAAITRAFTSRFRKAATRKKSPYGDGRASQRIVRVIEKQIANDRLFVQRLHPWVRIAGTP